MEVNYPLELIIGGEGGAGSGNFGHKGRKGKRGGSLPKGGTGGSNVNIRGHISGSSYTDYYTEDDFINDVSANMNNITNDEAKKIYNILDDYFGDGYRSLRLDDNKKAERELIEKYIKEAPKFDGTIYRGTRLNVDDLSVGNTIDLGTFNSWSSSVDLSNGYAKSKAIISRNKSDGKIPVIMKLNKPPKMGVSVMHLSTFKDEEEILMSGMSKYKITKVNKKKYGKYDGYEIDVNEVI